MAKAALDDTRAFTELVRRYQTRVVHLVSRLLNDREVSEDIAQEVFVRVHLHRRNYRTGSKFSMPWVPPCDRSRRRQNASVMSANLGSRPVGFLYRSIAQLV